MAVSILLYLITILKSVINVFLVLWHYIFVSELQKLLTSIVKHGMNTEILEKAKAIPENCKKQLYNLITNHCQACLDYFVKYIAIQSKMFLCNAMLASTTIVSRELQYNSLLLLYESY